LGHYAKQRDIVTRVAVLDKLLQRAERAERQRNLQSGQNNVKVNYNVVGAKTTKHGPVVWENIK
jgi:hypothetical protein